MGYWLLVSTIFWSASFGMYHSKEQCEEAAKDAPLLSVTTCITLPLDPPHAEDHHH